MRVYEYSPKKNKIKSDRLIALGFFDGVHEGHRHLLKIAKQTAHDTGLLFSVFTFKAECDLLKSKTRLYSTDEKLKLLSEIGADEVILADFNELSGVEAESFITDIIIGDLGCRTAVTGLDFRFGKGARGDVKLLREMLSAEGADAILVEDVTMGGEKISTTRIKKLLGEGRIDEANKLLGSPYFLSAKVEHGIGKGKKLGFPTVNTALDAISCPLKRGVYRTSVSIGDESYGALTNIGTCPTMGERAIHAETNILNFNDDLYEKDIYIVFHEYLREEITFKSEKELILQIKVDINRVKTEMEKHNGRKLD